MLLRLQYASRCGLGRSCCRHHASRRQPSLVVPAVCALHQQQQQQQQLVQPVVLRSSSSHAAGPPPRHRAVAAHASTGSSSPTAAAAAAATAAEQTQPPPPPVEAFPEMVLQLPPPANSLVKRAEFVKSSVEVAQCPPPRFPEFAVIGRSNVGKSSLINMLTNRKSLAMVSKQPGKTRCINHFRINDSWYLVDLPGYGYARRGKQDRADFEAFTQAYFKRRATLAMVLLLVDCSIPPQEVDVEYAAWLARAELPFSIVFTKADKRKKGEPRHTANIAAFKRALLEQGGFTLLPPSLVTSSSTGGGKQELLNFIAALRVAYEQQQQGGGGKRKRTDAEPAQDDEEEEEA